MSSGGGHWVQLLRLKDAFKGCDVTYATVLESSRGDVAGLGARFSVLPDATRWNKFRLIWLLVRIVLLMVRERPDVVVTTGAAPGYLSLVVGRLMGRRTCWIDSIANVEELSMSGRKARRWADLWLTQWRHLARAGGPEWFGNVLSRDPIEGTDETLQDESGAASRIDLPRTRIVQATDGRKRPPRVLAISSGGGHWVELMRLVPAFEDCEVVFASVNESHRRGVEAAGYRYHRVPDLTRWNVGRVPWCFLMVGRLLLRERPDVIVTTGAAPGYVSCILGKMLGIRCCWVDSIANAETLSMSGTRALRWSDLLLTQWPKLAGDGRAQYKGNVL